MQTLILQQCQLLIHAFRHWLADVYLIGFTFAFTLSLGNSECSRKPLNAHCLGLMGKHKKMKKHENIDRK